MCVNICHWGTVKINNTETMKYIHDNVVCFFMYRLPKDKSNLHPTLYRRTKLWFWKIKLNNYKYLPGIFEGIHTNKLSELIYQSYFMPHAVHFKRMGIHNPIKHIGRKNNFQRKETNFYCQQWHMIKPQFPQIDLFG